MRYGIVRYELDIDHEYTPEPPFHVDRDAAQREADRINRTQGDRREAWVVEMDDDHADTLERASR